MSNKIIDFNEHRKNKGCEPREDEVTMEQLMENLDSLPENELMSSAADYVNGHMMKLLGLMDLGKQVTELLTSIGLDPDDFTIDEESANRYLTLDDFEAAETPFNGPFFDHYTDDDAQIRVVTAFQPDDDEDTINLLMAVMKLEDGADHWQRFGDNGWEDDGPPADIFDDLDDWDDEDWDDDEDDEDDDDLPFQQEPWEDEYDESIYALYLSPQTYRALSRAGIETAERLKQMTDLELLAIDGIGAKELEIIHQAVDDEDYDEDEDAGE